MKNLALFILCMTNAIAAIRADEPIVFISAFNPGDKGAIHAFQFDTENGQLKPLHRTTNLENPFFLSLSPDKRFLYAIDAKQFGGSENEFVAAFALNGRSGKLTRLNRESARGTASCYLDVDRTGKVLLVANYSSGNVAALPVQKDGSLGAASSFVQHIRSGNDSKSQKAARAHSIVASPDNRFVMAADLGLDRIFIYSLKSDSAELAPNRAQPYVPLPPGSGPRHLVFHPDGNRLYAINELKNTVTFFDYATKTGTLILRQTISTLPKDFSGLSHTADLKITPDGRFLYGTNRGHDSIAIFRIQDNGRLSLIKIEPSLGKGPQNLLISPDGHWLLCANMPGDNVIVFAINLKTGSLKASGKPMSIPMPSCIRWLNAP